MIIAIHLKTESGDAYLFHKDVVQETEMLDYIEKHMDTELVHVYDHEVSIVGDGDTKFMSKILQNKIEELREQYDV